MRWIIVMALCTALLAFQPVTVSAQQEVIITAEQYDAIIGYISYLIAIYNNLNLEVGPKLLSIKNAVEGMLGYVQVIHDRAGSIDVNVAPLHGDLLALAESLGGWLDEVEMKLSSLMNNTDGIEAWLQDIQYDTHLLDDWLETIWWDMKYYLGNIHTDLDWRLWEIYGTTDDLESYTDQVEPLLVEIRDKISGVSGILTNIGVTVTGLVNVDFSELIAEIHTDLWNPEYNEPSLTKIERDMRYAFFENTSIPDLPYLAKIKEGIWDSVHQEGYLVKLRDGTWDWAREEGYPKRTAEALWDYNYDKSRVATLIETNVWGFTTLTETNVWGFTMLAGLLGGATSLLSNIHGDLSSNVYVSGVETSALPDYGEQLAEGRTGMDNERQGFEDVHVETLGVTNSLLSAVTNRFNWLAGWQDIEPQYSYYIFLPWPFNSGLGLDWSWAETTLEVIKDMIAWALYVTAAVGAVLVLRSGIA